MADSFIKRLIKPVIVSLGKRKARKCFSDDPVIICGCGRSGTTLLLSILDAHPHIFGLDEHSFLNRWKPIKPNNRQKNKIEPVRQDRFYRYLLSKHIPREITRYCEKCPSLVRTLDSILTYFNQKVKIIHLVRDGRDVLTSRHPSRPDQYWVSIDRWVNDVREGLEHDDHPCVFTVKYEDLIGETKNTLHRVFDFIGEQWSDDLIDWHEKTSIRKSNAWFGPLQKLHSASLQKWKKEENRSRLDQIMADNRVVSLLERLKYI